METVFAVFNTLGINYTVGMQLSIFIFVFLSLYYILFKPYYEAYEARSEQTFGNQDLAERVIKETENLEDMYQAKARKLQVEHKKIYDSSKSEALHEYDSIVFKSRKDSKEKIAVVKIEIEKQFELAKVNLGTETSNVASAIVDKLLIKEK